MAEAERISVPAAPLACPTCGGPVARNRNVCGECGALVTMEATIQQVGADAQDRLGRLRRHLPRPSRQLILLVMAAFPLAVGPAVLAALYIGYGLAGARDHLAPGDRSRYLAILVLAVVNISLSLWFWDAFGSALADRAAELLDQLLARPGARVYQI